MAKIFNKNQAELSAIFVDFNVWFMLGWYDIKQRYRRSVIGPFWITLSSAAMVGSIGLMFSVIFQTSIEEFLPYFAAGQILWIFISSQISEACQTFIQSQHIIKQISLPLSVHVMRKLWQNVIMLGHNLLIVFLAIALLGKGFSLDVLYAIPAFVLILILLFPISIMLGIVCSRFRDITQIVGIFLQLIYFFTPIFWMKKLLPEEYSWVTIYNPFYHMIEIIRAPLLGYAPEPMLWLYILSYIVLSTAAALIFLKKYRNRVAYWV